MAAIALANGIAGKIARMDRQRLTHELLHFQGRIRLDFTKEYIGRQSVDRLRHILLAAWLKAKV